MKKHSFIDIPYYAPWIRSGLKSRTLTTDEAIAQAEKAIEMIQLRLRQCEEMTKEDYFNLYDEGDIIRDETGDHPAIETAEVLDAEKTDLEDIILQLKPPTNENENRVFSNFVDTFLRREAGGSCYIVTTSLPKYLQAVLDAGFSEVNTRLLSGKLINQKTGKAFPDKRIANVLADLHHPNP